eukprot:5239246-Amphidinium_carterae.1
MATRRGNAKAALPPPPKANTTLLRSQLRCLALLRRYTEGELMRDENERMMLKECVFSRAFPQKNASIFSSTVVQYSVQLRSPQYSLNRLSTLLYCSSLLVL